MDPLGHASPAFGVAYRFATSPDLVFCLTDVITNKRQLAALRLVNTLFHAAATPQFFRSFRVIQVSDHNRLMAASQVLGFIRGIIFERRLGEALCSGSISAGLLEQLPLLEEFTSTYPISAATCLDLRRHCPKLKSLHLDFPYHKVRIDSWSDYRMPLAELREFEGLRELSLLNLNDSDSSEGWARQIACMLSKSPRLKRLSVVLCGAAAFEIGPDHVKWFGMLCEAYWQTGAEPLALQELQCRPGSLTVECPSFHKMVNLQALEEVRFHSDGPVNLFAAVMNGAPNLRRFSAWRYLPEMHVELCRTMDPVRIQNLAVFFQEQDTGAEMACMLSPRPRGLFPASPLQPRMMDIGLDRDMAGRNGTMDKDFSDLGAAEVLQLLVSGPGRDVLEGLQVTFSPTINPAMPPTTEVEALKGVLPSLRKLSQLRVITTLEEDACMFFDSSDIQRHHLQTPELALQLAKASRHLRYISVRNYRWRIIWHDDLDMTQLEELSNEQGLEVELFGLTRDVWTGDADMDWS